MAISYTRHIWTVKEKIASAKLNHIEEGVETAQETANKTLPLLELRAAYDALLIETRAKLRDLEKRIEALEDS